MSAHDILIMVTIVVYLAAMVVIGVIYSKKTNSVTDFYLGGRTLGPIVTAMSAEASDMSAYLLMGIPGVAILSGLAEAGWTAIGLALGTYLNWLLVAKPLRNYSNHIKAITVPEFFANRYRDDKHVISLIASIIIVVFFIPYTASGFNACGTLFSTLFGFDYFTAMVVSAIVLVLYTTMGGFLAASFTDLIQSIVMTAALVIVVIYGIHTAGGADAVMENAKALPGYLSLNHIYDYTTGTANVYTPLKIASILAWGLGYFGMPHVLLRFMAIEHPNKLKASRRIACSWVVISMFIAIAIGFIGKAMITNGAITDLAPEDSQRIIIKISLLLSNEGVLATLLAGVIFSGILAATMSTADSQLLAASSSISEDIARDFFGIKLTEKKRMLIARLTIVAIAIVAIIWARKEGTVFYIVSFAWAGFGATFGPLMLVSLFWKRSNKYGALAGLITGGVMVFVWKYAIAPMGGILNIYELLPAFVLSLVANVVVSLITGKPDPEIEKEYEEVRQINKGISRV